MPADSDFVDHCLELLAALGVPHARRMFGGQGLYVDKRFLALVWQRQLYLKTDDQTRPAFEAAGSQPFAFAGRDGKPTTTSYWSAPDEAMDSPALMLPWARLALDSALRTAAGKRGSSRVAKTVAKAAPKPAPKPASKIAASANELVQAAPPVRPARKRSR